MLSDLEAHSGVILGPQPGAERRASTSRHPPAEALIRACAETLRLGPCVVAFSGGRDSSLVLAAMVAASRAHGLAMPTPVTLRFPGDPDSQESDHQEEVISALGIDRWRVIDCGEEMDLLGPRSTAIMTKLGHVWPANHYFMDPIAEAFPDATLVTGLEGDGLMGGWRWARATHPARPRDLLTALHAVVPRTMRTAIAYSGQSLDVGWLRPGAASALESAFRRELASEPAIWSRRVGWWFKRRYLAIARGTLDAVCGLRGVKVAHPLLDRGFLASVATAGGMRGFASRADAMREMFSGLVPDSIIERDHKAFFDQTFWGPHSRDFADRWRGEGLSAEIVDPDALREEWTKPEPDFRSATPLQRAWLAAQ